MTDHLRNILETNQKIKRRIQRFINEYQNYQTDFVTELRAIPKTAHLEDEYDFKNFTLDLEHQFNFDHVQLAVCGPNGSGKSSFIHSFLQIGAILPAGAGPVTARIVKLTHAPAAKACLNVYPSISSGLAQERREVQLNLSQFFDQPTKTNWVGIHNEIKVHLGRPNDLSEEDFDLWAKRFVEICIPSPVLELGIDVYDTPGFLFHDKFVMRENLLAVVKEVKPLLIFVYDNPSVANDAHDCFLALQSTLGNLVQSTIFFLNTKQDVTTLFAGAGINVSQRHLFTEEKFYEILPSEREKRLDPLFNHKVMKNYLHRDKTILNFEICSIRTARGILPRCTDHMTESAILRIIQFAVRMDLERPYAVVNKILDSIDSFFQFTLTTSHRDPEQWKRIRQDAQVWGASFFKKSQQEMSVQIDLAYRNILRYFDQCSENISERAIRSDRTNHSLQLKSPQITKFIDIAVQEEVVKVAVNEIINLTKEALRLHITREITVNSDYNELLLAAQRQVLIDISATELEQRTWLESIILNLSMVPTAISRIVKGLRTRLDVEYWNNKRFEDFHSKEEYDAYNSALDSYEVLTNPDKRKDFAETYLVKMKIHIVDQETIFKRNLKEWMEGREKIFFENIRSNYTLAVKHLSARQSAYEKTKTYTGQFARIQCQLLAMKHLQKFNGQTPVIDNSFILGQGALFVVYAAQWGQEKSLVVKKLRQPSLDEPNLQYIEAHYHRKITKLGIPNTVPLLYLCMNPRDDESLWMFLPRYRQSLFDYLQANIREIKPDQIVKIALDMADVLSKLHSFEIVHRDFKSKNILLDENDQCYLADFGTCKQTAQNNTIVGTYPFPPELFADRNSTATALTYNGMAVDIYSFGVLLYELLPKLQYHRPHATSNGIDVTQLLKNVSRFDINGNEYELLIEACLANKVEQRPTASQVVEKLKAIRKILEQKICTLCDVNVRQCRYHPCGHKYACQVCYDKLKRNAQNKVVCNLCRKVVEKWEDDDCGSTFYLKR